VSKNNRTYHDLGAPFRKRDAQMEPFRVLPFTVTVTETDFLKECRRLVHSIGGHVRPDTPLVRALKPTIDRSAFRNMGE